MKSEFLRGTDDTQPFELETASEEKGRVVGRVRAAWISLRDAYYTRIDELEHAFSSY